MIRRSAAAVTLLLFLAAGCGSTATVPVDSPSSPLGNGGDHVVQCGPDPSGGIMTFGGTGLVNNGTRAVTIERVSFYGDHHLRLAHAVIVPVHGSLIGIAYGWPPPQQTLRQTGVRWNERVPVAGATVPPGKSEADERNLIIGMVPTAHRGVADGVQVRYREGHHQYVLRTHTKSVIIIAKSTPNC